MADAADLFERVRQILMHDWDPIGIRDVPQAQDEYDRYARQIARMLDAGASTTEIADRLLEIEAGSIGLPGDGERAIMVARRLCRLSKP